MLNVRRYIEVTGAPAHPGEFSFTGNGLRVMTREFRTGNGEMIAAAQASVAIGAASDDRRDNNDDARAVVIEPQIISFLGSDEVRASSFTPLADIPLMVQQAVLAIEDERFYKHHGIDIIGIARAMLTNIMALRLVQGGSTLTQQLAKNIFLSPKRTLSRKLLELPTALSIERHRTKDQILEMYLNEVYLGQEGAVAIHGFPTAASSFFGKKLSELSLDEAALLAGIIKAPSTLSPRKHAKRALERRNLVLAKMLELGFINDRDFATAMKRPVKTIEAATYRRVAPYFTAALETELGEQFELEGPPLNGMAVYTGIELGLQECAESAIKTGLAQLEKSRPKLSKGEKHLEAALVALEPFSGLVKAWVGGRDFAASQFNRVNQGRRQIGSTIKPFLYLTALDRSLNSYKVASPVSILEDKPMAIAQRSQVTWIPENYDHDFRGDVTLRYALENSLNMPAIYVAERIGVPALKNTLQNFALAEEIQEVPALALGALDTNLLRLTAGYGALANSGVHIQPRLYLSALAEDGERLASSEISEHPVADENAVYVLTNILQGVIERGTARTVRTRGFMREAAGKTGTSNDARDAWFVGFTPNMVAGVWVGFDDDTPTGLTGAVASAPIWADFMKCSAPFIPDVQFIPPRGVTFVQLDRNSRERATPDCPAEDLTTEVFVAGTEPTRDCHLHGLEGDHGEVRPRLLDEETPAPRRERSLWDAIFG